MAFWNFDNVSVVSHKDRKGRTKLQVERRKKSKSRSRSRSRSPKRGSFFGGDSYHGKHHKSSSSFFGLPSASRSSFFGLGRGPSYYKRSPRHGFIHRAYRKLKHLLRNLVHYAKHHPFKVFMLVLVPLMAGGALTALLARFGLRMPPTIERLLGLASKAATGDSIGLVGEAVRMAGSFSGSGGSNVSIERGRDGGLQWERKSVRGGRGGRGGGEWGDGIMNVAKMFS